MVVWQNWEFPFSTLRKFWVVFSDFFGGDPSTIEGELIEFFVKNSWQLGDWEVAEKLIGYKNPNGMEVGSVEVQ